MPRLTPFAAVALALGAIAEPAMAQDTACASEGPDAPLALHTDWIMEGYERREGDAPFVFADKMARYYDIDDPVGVFWDTPSGPNWRSGAPGAPGVDLGLGNVHTLQISMLTNLIFYIDNTYPESQGQCFRGHGPHGRNP